MSRTFSSVTCLGCGCACDDIAVSVENDRIVEVRQTCDLGARWFAGASAPRRPPQVSGRPVSMEDVLAAAATLLKHANMPLVYLAPELSCDAQREAVALADAVGAALDTVSSSAPLASVLAAQEQGRVSATLGEIRNRADVLVFWGTDPSATHPRFWSRYAPEPAGRHLPAGRRSRTVVAVDIGDRRGPGDADLRIAVDPAHETGVLTLAAAIRPASTHPGSSAPVRERESPPPTAADPSQKSDTASAAAQLAAAACAGRYVAIVVDGEDAGAARDGSLSLALGAFAQSLNDVTRAALCTLRGGGNRCGADAVMTWQTGFPVAVEFTRGYPEYRPYDGTAAARLARGEIDAALVIGAPALIPRDVRARLFGVRCVVIGPRADADALDRAHATIDTGIAGIHEHGLAYRMDDVPVRLQAVLDGPPLVAPLLRDLRRRCLAS